MNRLCKFCACKVGPKEVVVFYFGRKSLYSTIGVHMGVGNWKLFDWKGEKDFIFSFLYFNICSGIFGCPYKLLKQSLSENFVSIPL